MPKIIGISGAQGGGKTSLLNELALRGWIVDDFKVSRQVQENLGATDLNDAVKDPASMMRFQDAVLSAKFNRDYMMRTTQQHQLNLTERTFADIAAYTTHWVWKLVDAGKWTMEDAMDWLKPYIASCRKYQKECYDGVLLLPFMPHIPWDDSDSRRADKTSACRIYEDVERFTQHPSFIDLPRRVIQLETVHDRANEAEKFLKELL